MSGINKAILVGRLGQDPELRYTQGGTPVCNLSIATSRAWIDKQSNERVEETEWHRVVVWNKQAEHCNKYLAKGRQVYIEGRLQTSSYNDKDGKKCYSTEIVAETVQFLGSNQSENGDQRRGGEERNRQGSGSNSRNSNSRYENNDPHGDSRYVPVGPDDDDPIPF